MSNPINDPVNGPRPCASNYEECGPGFFQPCSECCSGTSQVSTRGNKKGQRLCGTYNMLRGFGPEYKHPNAKPNCKPVGTKLDDWTEGGSCCSLQVSAGPDGHHYCASRPWTEARAWGWVAAPVAAVAASGGLVGGGRGDRNVVMAIVLGLVLYVLIQRWRRKPRRGS